MIAFGKAHVDQRIDWLNSWKKACRQRREHGWTDHNLYGEKVKEVIYRDFVNKELVCFMTMECERAIPSVIDGFKPDQRQVFFTCIKRNDTEEVKVAELVASVAEHSAFNQDEARLVNIVVGLAQNKNINLLTPSHQVFILLTCA